MNASPHTHELRIYTDNDGDIIIKYGDQPSHCVYHYWPGWRSRVTRCAKRMIRAHDRQSLKAGERESLTAALKERLVLREAAGLWGREVLNGAALPAPSPSVLSVSRRPGGMYQGYAEGEVVTFYGTQEAVEWAKVRGLELEVL